MLLIDFEIAFAVAIECSISPGVVADRSAVVEHALVVVVVVVLVDFSANVSAVVFAVNWKNAGNAIEEANAVGVDVVLPPTLFVLALVGMWLNLHSVRFLDAVEIANANLSHTLNVLSVVGIWIAVGAADNDEGDDDININDDGDDDDLVDDDGCVSDADVNVTEAAGCIATA